MKNVEITGYGYSLPKNRIQFGNQTRYRIGDGESQLTLCVDAAKKALENAELSISEIDCIIAACAVVIQPIPCSAAVLHHALSAPEGAAAIDISTTCSGFITALDLVSYLIDSGRYKNVLLISGDTASIALPEDDKHIYELFSDAACAAVLKKSDGSCGVVAACQKTYSQGIDMTCITAGGTEDPPFRYTPERDRLYRFQMDGLRVAGLTVKYLKRDYRDFLDAAGITADDIDIVIPHQLSPALPSLMKYLGLSREKYLNFVGDYGNMVSASVPFALAKGIESGAVRKGSRVLLLGTAAGLTFNLLYFIY